jgi:ComF family protein
MKKILDFLFPNYTCIACECEINVSETQHLCDECFSALKHTNAPKTSAETIIGKNTASKTICHLENIYCPFYYETPMSDAILNLKYGSEGLVAPIFAPFMVDILSGDRFDMLVPVPLTNQRFNERGYNQAELLAREVFALLDIPVNTDVLVRVKQPAPQNKMSTDERKENQADAFKVTDKETIKGKTILVVDDVLASGATANEIARTLKKAGALGVSVLVLARVDDF